MRFASIGASNANNYAAAGQAVVNQTGKINKAAIESGVDFGKLAIDGMKARSYEKQAAMNAEAHVAKAGLRAAASVQKSAIKADAKVASDKSKIKTQMAGRVAAMGKIMAKGLSGSKSKRPVAPATYDLSGMMKDYDETIAKYTKKAADIRSSIPQSTEVATNSQGTGVTDNGSTIQDSPGGAVGGSTSSSTKSPGSIKTWDQAYGLAEQTGAKFPELIAAQWALESGYGSSLGGTHNYFGQKGSKNESTSNAPTWEEKNGQAYGTTADFKNFGSPLESFQELNSRWHNNYGSYTGVATGSTSAAEAARQLSAQGYATDSKYADKLIAIMTQHGY